jgi:FtsZ-binding cell division protein ZapB
VFSLYPDGTAAEFKNSGDPTNRSSPFPIHHPATPTFETHIDRITQIIILTSQLEASLAHNARINARLSTALDTLDILQAELDAERRKNDKHMWMNLIQELQREKDEMKEVVEFLIRKGKPFLHFDETVSILWPISLEYSTPFQSRDPKGTSTGGRLP